MGAEELRASARMLWVVCCVLLVSQAAARDPDYCYSEDENPYLMFSTKTAYEFVHEKPRNPENVPYCQPVQFWLLARHGTRFPDREDITMMEHLPELRDQILRNHETRKQGRLCEEDLEKLKKWSVQVFPTQANYLANQGYDDMKFMARRFRTQFPTLLNKTFREDTYVFRTTDTQRTKASAKAFAEGIFGSASFVHIPEPFKNDTLIQGYSSCQRWRDLVLNNNRTYDEKKRFEMEPIMQAMVQNVSSRLGFNYMLTFKQIDDMYDMCRFDKAWNIRQVSPWCAVFSKQELQLLEYREDLEKYYLGSYGNDINVKLGCPPVKDFMNRFSQVERNNHQPLGVFYFTHSKMLQMIMARLEIAKDDEPLTHSNYNIMKGRKWRTSTLAPFSTNLAAVFFKCDVGEMYRVMFFIGEKLYNYKGCNVGLCNWSFIKDKFEAIANDCNLDFCSRDWSGARQIHATLWPIFTVVLVVLHSVLFKRM